MNQFLAKLCKNFTYENFNVQSRPVLSDPGLTINSDLVFEPDVKEDFWSLGIRKKDSFEIFDPQVDPWLSGYSILLKAVQTLT